MDGPGMDSLDKHAVVARVDENEISVHSFNATYIDRLIRTGRNDTREEREAHLDELINTYLLAEEARARGLDDARYETFVDRKRKLASGGHFVAVALADSLADLTEAEVRTAFRNSQTSVSVRHMLFRTSEEAEAAYSLLEAGASFRELAAASFRRAPSDTLAGYIDRIGYWQMDDAFAETAFSLSVGEYSAPVRTRYGWHIIRTEDRFDPPILTESEYRRRRESILSQARQRRLRLEADRFIREFMEDRDVIVEREGLLKLQEAIRIAFGDRVEDPAIPLLGISAEEVEMVRSSLEPETLLASFETGGEVHSFTAADYAAWIEELPYQEVRYRTGMSVGRAIRNEALALEAFRLGLERNSNVANTVHFEAVTFLAGRLRDQLRSGRTTSPSDAELRHAYERLGYRTLEYATATYWVIPFSSLESAEMAKRNVDSNPEAASSYRGFSLHEDEDLDQGAVLGRHLRFAPIHEPVVIGLDNGEWYLANVSERSLHYRSFEEARSDIEDRIAPILSEVRLLEELRASATIEIHWELFDKMLIEAGLH